MLSTIKLHIKRRCGDNDDDDDDDNDDDNDDGKGSAAKRSLCAVNGLFTRPFNGGIFGFVCSDCMFYTEIQQ